MELGLALGHALRHDHADGRVPGLHRDLQVHRHGAVGRRGGYVPLQRRHRPERDG